MRCNGLQKRNNKLCLHKKLSRTFCFCWTNSGNWFSTKMPFNCLVRILFIPTLFHCPLLQWSIYKSLFQSCNKSLINLACSRQYWKNIGPGSFLYGMMSLHSVCTVGTSGLTFSQYAWPSHLVNKMYLWPTNLKPKQLPFLHARFQDKEIK